MSLIPDLVLPERHLGLVQAGETDELGTRLEGLANAVESSLDIDRLIALARSTRLKSTGDARPLPPPGQRIALASDKAFSFVYPHVLSGWRAAGAEIVTFSPLADEPPPPDCDVCWLPGGYPELHAGRIAGAERFLGGLRRFAQSRPVHGECGGYMVLGRSLEDGDGHRHPMAGLLPVETSYAKRKMHLGYRVAHLLGDGAMGRAGQRLVGHEFHYASVTESDASRETAFAAIADAEGKDLGTAGHRLGHVTGSFFHVIAHG
jgi:cobyrinic acid a,c-diamide synthase